MARKINTKTIAAIGMLSAVAYAATLVSHLLPPLAMGFLKYDPKDIVIAICGFIYGPASVVAVSIITSVAEMLTISTTGPIGLIMNILATCAFACPGAIIYKKVRSSRGAVAGLSIGVVVMTAIMILWNWLITPLYTQMPREAITPLLLTVFLPFNLFKGILNMAGTLLLYKPLSQVLKKARLIQGEPQRAHIKSGLVILSVVLLITAALVALVWLKVI